MPYAINTNNAIFTREKWNSDGIESSMFEWTQVANSINLVPAICVKLAQ